MKNSYDYKNPRIKKARLKAILNTPPIFALNFALFLLLFVSGIFLLVSKFSLGWLLLGFSPLFLMLNFWIKNDLSEIKIGKTKNITDLLSEELLTLFDHDPSPEELAKILSKTSSGAFIMIRFGLGLPFFLEVAKILPNAIEPIFETARTVRDETDSEEISGAVLAVAMIKNLPNYETILGQLKLSLEDLYSGVTWFNYLYGVVKESKRPVRSGGIARDLAFGYTPTLERFAMNISSYRSSARTKIQQADHAEIIKKIINNLTKGGRKNACLIGAYGSGRSTIVNSLAETLMDASEKIPNSLKFSQIYSLDAPSLISASRNRGELEYLMIKILNEIYSAKNIVLCLDNAHLFFEEGPGSVDISNLLTPILEAGKIRIILIMDDQKFLEISARNSVIGNVLNKIVVPPTNREETLKVLMDQVPFFEYEKGVIYTYRSLLEAYRLSEQYIHDVEMPGKAKLLLESAASYADAGIVTENSVATAVEKSYGVKVKVAEKTEDREKLLNLESLIHEHMIDQVEAVSAVSNALRRAAAGVKNASRPIGTFLFLGPTGVGKTELAKTLARVYFGGENNIIRLDMNEFVAASDVARLIEDGAKDPHSLTAEVMKQPFSVVLLDEIEKAHPSVLTTLLQALDEGILRDEKNREISFRDTIIIATSNAGAAEIREQISAGKKIEDFKEEFVEELISSNEFKPEFLNRFDEICLFKPLEKDDLLKVLDLMIKSTNQTLAPQNISVELSSDAKQILIEKGYDPKMGARPMRRLVQKTVENIVAAAILSGAIKPGGKLTITSSEINIT